MNRPTRPSAQHNPFKTDPQYPCELRLVGLGAVGNQLSHFLGSLHEELRLETHSCPAVLTKSCVQKRTKVPRYWRTKVHWYEHKGPLERKKEIPTHPLAPVRSTGDTRPNPVTFATDAHDALAAVTSQQIIPGDRQSLRIYRPNGPKRRRSVWHLSPVRGRNRPGLWTCGKCTQSAVAASTP